MSQNAQQRKSFYNFDVNTTTKCNLRCTYCIEHEWFKKPEEKPTEDLTQDIIEKVDAMLNSKRFLDKHSGIGFNFWGGEPSMNPEFIIKMVNLYRDEPRIKFFMYSNGFNLTKIMPLLEEFKNEKAIDGTNKLFIQVSYDGKASHDVARLDVGGHGSADKVKETLTKLRDRGIPYSTKATIGFYELKYIAANYREHLEMSRQGYAINAYGPTIDYLSDYTFDPVEMREFNKILKEQIFEIAKEEIAYYKQNGRFFFNWLNHNKALCSAGEHMSLIDVDGDVLVCHGAIYEENRDDHKLANIKQTNTEFINNLMDAALEYGAARTEKPLPKECQACHTHFCMKCNVKKTSVSEKEDYFEQWTDFSNQDHLCQLFKHLGTIRIALMKIIEKN